MWFLEIFLCSWLFSSLTIFVQEILAYPPPLLHLTIPTQRKSGWPGLISVWCANAPSPAGEHVLPILCSEPHACISSQGLVPWNSMLVRNHQLPMPPSKSALDLSFTVRSPCHHPPPQLPWNLVGNNAGGCKIKQPQHLTASSSWFALLVYCDANWHLAMMCIKFQNPVWVCIEIKNLRKEERKGWSHSQWQQPVSFSCH